MRYLLVLLFFARVGWAGPDLSQAIQLNVDKYQLSNGLTVLLHEDHSVPLSLTISGFASVPRMRIRGERDWPTFSNT